MTWELVIQLLILMFGLLIVLFIGSAVREGIKDKELERELKRRGVAMLDEIQKGVTE